MRSGAFVLGLAVALLSAPACTSTRYKTVQVEPSLEAYEDAQRGRQISYGKEGSVWNFDVITVADLEETDPHLRILRTDYERRDDTICFQETRWTVVDPTLHYEPLESRGDRIVSRLDRCLPMEEMAAFQLKVARTGFDLGETFVLLTAPVSVPFILLMIGTNGGAGGP